MKVIIDNKIPFIKGALEEFADVIYKDGSSICSDDVKDADALIIRTRTHCNSDLLDGSSVKAIFTATIGYDHIDTKYCDQHGIVWKNAPGCNAASVQQYVQSVFAHLHSKLGMTLAGQKIAVVGVGHVGKLIINTAQSLGMEILPVDPVRARKEPHELFYAYKEAISKADIVTYHTPLTKEGRYATYHLFDENILPLLRKGVTVINTSRGEVTDTNALHKGLESGIIGNLILDVWEKEPDIDKWLLQNATIATPHIAGYSADSKWNGTLMSVRAISKQFGLGLDNWQPEKLESPVEPTINIKGINSFEDGISKIWSTIYNVMGDCEQLRAEPEKFEYLRGNYPIRREAKAYNIESDTKIRYRFEDFGLNLKSCDTDN